MSDADPTRLGYNDCVLRNIIRAGWALLAWLVLFTPRGTALATHSSTHSSKHFQAPQALSLKLGNQVFNDLNNNGLRDADGRRC